MTIVAALIHGAAGADTATYSTPATRALVTRGMARHAAQDSGVIDYRAKLRYRVSFGVARRKWGNPLPLAVEEQEATLSWQRPNDLRVDLLGRRSASRFEGADVSSTFDHPWFVPRVLGDSIRVFGASETPARAAPHPLAPGADQFYRYVGGDSVVVAMNGRRITVRAITVTPKRAAGSYVAGQLWLEVSSGDVVRFTFRFVGTELWSEPEGHTASDSADARRENAIVSRILELNADLEYGLQENRYWMPYREVISGRVSLPLGIDFAVPFEAKTTFDDYTINTGSAVVFDAPFPPEGALRGRNRGRLTADDTTRATRRRNDDSLHAAGDSSAWRFRASHRTGYLADGGRYEIHRPSADSMRNYAGWDDPLVLDENAADDRQLRQAVSDLARISESLPREMTGRPGAGITWEKVADILRYNRVEGTTLSLAERVPTSIPFTDLYGTLRYGFADHRVMARVAAVRDAPAGRLTVAMSRDLQDTDPFATGISFGNSLRAIFTGHDDGGYLLAAGGRASYETTAGRRTELTLSARAEDERSVTSRARAFVPRIAGSNGYFPATAPVREGFALGGGLRLDRSAPTTRWIVDGDGVAVNHRGAARMTGELRLQRLIGGWLAARVKGGVAFGTDSVPQLALRAGGMNTVRGYDFGVTQGDLMWAVQLDVARPGRGAVKVVGFVDAGAAMVMAHVGAAQLLSGAGVGVSVLGGMVRADLSHPLTHAADRGFRFDLVFGGFR